MKALFVAAAAAATLVAGALAVPAANATPMKKAEMHHGHHRGHHHGAHHGKAGHHKHVAKRHNHGKHGHHSHAKMPKHRHHHH